MRKISVMLCMLLCLATAWAQNKQVSGKVTDVSGNPIPGITVKVKGQKGGVSTDISGNFSISVPSNATLQFTGIGYEPMDVNVSNRSTVELQMAIEAKSLSEVVVTGTGVATDKRKLSIDVASVNSKDFSKSAILSVDQALIGKVAGAQIQTPSGEPGQKANIILRGVNSLGSTTPIILVDGVQVTDINGLDIASVDRVEVAKGPSAGMLYGAQGANGVIQIFTKKGGRNKRTSVFLNSKVSFDNAILGNGGNLVMSKHHYKTDAQGNILDQNGNPIAPAADGQWPDPAEEDFNTNFDL